STETMLLMRFSRKVFQVCEGGLRLRTRYLPTLVSPMSMPSLSNSPWMRGAPQRIVATHPANQLPNLFGHRWRPGLAATNFPGPEQPKALAMPANDGFRLDDDQEGSPIAPSFA